MPPKSAKRGASTSDAWSMTWLASSNHVWYQELVPKRVNLRRVDTPYFEDNSTVETEEPRGELQPIAARVLMKILYAARMCTFDLLRPCCFLATKTTKWDRSCDRALHRFVCYINSTLDV